MNESKPVFYGIGIAGAVAAAASFAFALPVAKFGVFNRLEIVIIALLLCGAFAALGVSRCAADPAAVRRMTRSPIAAILFLLAVWSIVTAPFSEYPWRSLLGPPQTGQGAFAILALACIAAIVAAFGPGKRFRLALAIASSAGAVLSAVTHLAPERYRPFEVPGYFVLLGLAAAAALASASIPRRVRYSLAALVLGLTLLVSENRTAFVAILAIGVPVVWISEIAIARGAAARLKRMATVAVLAMPFAVTALVWAAGHAGYGASIVARARIYDVMLAAFADRPVAILFGFGWGGVIEAFFRNLPAGAELLYGESWDVPVRDFHSAHNLALEFFRFRRIAGTARCNCISGRRRSDGVTPESRRRSRLCDRIRLAVGDMASAVLQSCADNHRLCAAFFGRPSAPLRADAVVRACPARYGVRCVGGASGRRRLALPTMAGAPSARLPVPAIRRASKAFPTIPDVATWGYAMSFTD